MQSDEELAAQIAKDLAYCVSSEARYQVAREIIRAVRTDERSRAAEVVRSCKPPVVDWTTQLVRQQLEAIAEIILNPAPPPPPTKGMSDVEK